MSALFSFNSGPPRVLTGFFVPGYRPRAIAPHGPLSRPILSMLSIRRPCQRDVTCMVLTMVVGAIPPRPHFVRERVIYNIFFRLSLNTKGIPHWYGSRHGWAAHTYRIAITGTSDRQDRQACRAAIPNCEKGVARRARTWYNGNVAAEVRSNNGD